MDSNQYPAGYLAATRAFLDGVTTRRQRVAAFAGILFLALLPTVCLVANVCW